jgi:hypothetical protein
VCDPDRLERVEVGCGCDVRERGVDGSGDRRGVQRIGDPASRNPFERRAGLSDGGYREQPLRPVVAALGAVLSARKGRRS